MPSQRKRIGFLPSEEVHNLIEKICAENKVSQSKVTGILVEEALRSRGVLKSSIRDISIGNYLDNQKLQNKNHFSINDNNTEYFNVSDHRKNKLQEDLEMINEFIEYKFFKKVMQKNISSLE